MGFNPTSDRTNYNNDGKKSNNILFTARVKDILLNEEQQLFKKLKGWADIGTIQFQPINSPSDNNTPSITFAKPLFTNIKQYPLKEELVLILVAPSNKLNSNPNSTDFYYFPYPVGMWNSNHINPFPDIPNFDNKPDDLNLGNTFKEKDGIKNLLPEEGDVIVEGRWGNSIRFSSTAKKNDNPWSSVGEDGDPILIIRNGQLLQPDSSPWTPTYEDINGDGSSMYMTSGQEIPLELACKNLQSFNITLSNSFNPQLIIPDLNSF